MKTYISLLALLVAITLLAGCKDDDPHKDHQMQIKTDSACGCCGQGAGNTANQQGK